VSGHPWVSVAWDAIQPGDVVRTPDGAEFHVTARIDMPADKELSFLLTPLDPIDGREVGPGVWTDRPRGTKVQAWRFNDSPRVPGAEAFAVGRLRLGGFSVTVLDE
jgi:hypothetical protein